MSHDPDNLQVSDIPEPLPGQAQMLLQASLERALTAEELRRLRAFAQADPAVADDCAAFGLLVNLRLEQRMVRYEGPAWDTFQALARRYTVSPETTAVSWRHWLARCMALWRPAVSPLAAGAMLVAVVQAGALAWLAHRPTQDDPMRGDGTGGANACPAVLVRLAPQTTVGELTRVLTQAQARVVNGPDGASEYRLVGPQRFVQDAGALLDGLAQEVRPAPGCAQPNE